jgi:hypothetical protein
MLDDGKISNSEYADLKAEVLEASGPDLPIPSGRSQPAVLLADAKEEDLESDTGRTTEKTFAGTGWLALTEPPSKIFLGSLAITSVLLLLASALGLIPWLTAFFGLTALFSTNVRHGRWMATAAATLAVSWGLVSFFVSDTIGPSGEGAFLATGLSEEVAEPEAPEGSLGVRLASLATEWNALGQPPFIESLIKSPESGPLDGFYYRFDDSALVAGAYNPSNDYVYGLVAQASLDHESVGQMYLHLCHLLHPFSQQCIDGYFDEGLLGGSLAEFADVEHSASWQLEGDEWRVSIRDNVLTIRVLDPQAG